MILVSCKMQEANIIQPPGRVSVVRLSALLSCSVVISVCLAVCACVRRFSRPCLSFVSGPPLSGWCLSVCAVCVVCLFCLCGFLVAARHQKTYHMGASHLYSATIGMCRDAYFLQWFVKIVAKTHAFLHGF